MAKPIWVYLVGAARKVWRWSPERHEAKKLAKKCALCKKKFKTDKDKQVDHIIPVGKAPRGSEGWDEYYKRLFCAKSNLQAICKKCHVQKTRQDMKDLRGGENGNSHNV